MDEQVASTARRLAELRERMHASATDLVALGPGPHTRWLLGFCPHADERPCLLLVGPEREAFLMPELNAEDVASQCDVELHVWADAAGPQAALREALAAVATTSARKVAVDETMRADFALLLLGEMQGAMHAFGGETVGALRQRKDEMEIELLCKNAAIADQAISAGMAAALPGVSEQAVASVVRQAFADAGATVEFTQVCAGAHGAMPHHGTDATKIVSGDAVVIDCGGRMRGYVSDITRMVVVGAAPAGYREVHDIVEAASVAARRAARPGCLAHEVDDAARQVITAAGYGEFFVHRTGHGLGLEVHEPPYITSTAQTVLEEGMVFSIEPGIYLPGRFGVRLEDIVVLREDGPEVLSRLPRTERVNLA